MKTTTPLAVLAVISLFAPPAEGVETAALAILGGPATRGSPVTVTITADTTGLTDDAYSFTATVTYATAELSFISSSFASTAWPSGAGITPFSAVDSSSPGILRIAYVADADQTAPDASLARGAGQVFVHLTFLPDSSPNRCGSTVIGFDTSSSDNNIVVNVNALAADGANLTLTPLTLAMSPAAGFVRGNANGGAVDGTAPEASVTIADGTFVLADLFGGGGDPPCRDAADANDDGRYNIVDAVTILQYVFANPAVMIPFPLLEIGSDPSADSLDCAALPSVTCP